MSKLFGDMTSDVTILKPGDMAPVCAGPTLRQTGWRGGIWVGYATTSDGINDFIVELSNGSNPIGFLTNGSEDYRPASAGFGSQHNYTGNQYRTTLGSAAGASTMTMMTNGGRALFRVYETVPLDGFGVRSAGTITYTEGDILRVSENGLLCNDSAVNLLAAGVTAVNVGTCCLAPTEDNGYKVGMDLKW